VAIDTLHIFACSIYDVVLQGFANIIFSGFVAKIAASISLEDAQSNPHPRDASVYIISGSGLHLTA